MRRKAEPAATYDAIMCGGACSERDATALLITDVIQVFHQGGESKYSVQLLLVVPCTQCGAIIAMQRYVKKFKACFRLVKN